MKVSSIIACLCLVFVDCALAQMKMPQTLKERISGKIQFYDIRDAVWDYYVEEKTKLSPTDTTGGRLLDRQLKFWNRWAYDCESRLESDGTVANWSKRMYEATLSVAKEHPTRAANSDWGLIGPTNVDALDGIGRVSRLAFHPTNASTVYAGTAHGGLWRTTNGGSSWSPISAYLPCLGVSGIEVSKTNSNIIYVLTGEGDAWLSEGFTFDYGYVGYSNGVMKTTDGGTTWIKTADFPGITGQYVGFQLRQDPNNSNTYLAATSDGIYRTTNGGTSWSASEFFHENGGIISGEMVCFDIEYKPGSSTTVYAGARFYDFLDSSTRYRFFKSTNGGADFDEINIDIAIDEAGLIRFEIGVTPASPNNVYLLCGPGYIEDGDGSNDSMNGFLRSTNSGDSFSSLATEPDVFAYNPTIGPTLGNQCLYDMALAISPTNSNYIFTGGLVVFRSTDGGYDFDGNTTYWTWEVGEHIHPDIHDLKYNPLDGKLYAAGDGGVHVTANNGGSWTSLYNGMSISQFYHSEPDNENNRFWGGTQDNGIMEQESGGLFGEFEQGDGYDVMTDNIVGNGNDSYWSFNNFVETTGLNGDYDITPPQPNENESRWFGNMDMHPTDEDYIYIGYRDAVWYSPTQGDDWETDGYYNRLDGGIVKGDWCLQVCPSNSSRIYCAGSSNMWRVDQINFQEAGTGSSTSLRNALAAEGFPLTDSDPIRLAKVTDILVHPSNSSLVWVTAGGFGPGAKVFYSSNAGGSWTNISYTLPNVPANCLVRDSDGTIYLGTDTGVYYLPLGGNDWIPYYNDLPRAPVTELHIVTIATIKYLYASTYGRGIWRTLTFTGCTSSLTISETLRGQQFFQASTAISSSSLVDAGTGTLVLFQSGDNITLTTGFEGKQGATFRGYIQPCNSGPIYENFMIPMADIMSYDLQPREAMIKRIENSSERIFVEVDIRTEGQYYLKLTKANGKVMRSSKVTSTEIGKIAMQIDTHDTPPGEYYVLITEDDHIVHLQEWAKDLHTTSSSIK